MRVPRILLLLCLAVGVGAVGYAARAHLREVRESLETAARRNLHQELKTRATVVVGEVHYALRMAKPVAVYGTAGNLLRPAPPAEARPFRPPVDSVVTVLLERGDAFKALQFAQSSAERAIVYLRQKNFEHALAEEALRGTELSYLVRQQQDDDNWVDDVGALLDGPSDRFARSLLRRGGVDPATLPGRAAREELSRVRPAVGLHCEADRFAQVTSRGDTLELRRVSYSEFDLGTGSESVPLPDPLAAVRVHGALDGAALDARVREEAWRLGALYGLAALILLVGTAYAYIAIGRAHRLATAKNEFVANVTHELKTPLANIRLFAESLQGGRVKEADQAEFVGTILEEAGRLDTLVEGLLHAARGARLEPATVDPAALLNETAERWRPRLTHAGCELSVIAPALPAVRGDKEALARALGNLIDNARKYAREDKRIELSGTASNGAVRLTVRDHGPGIPVQHRDKVMRPFTRLESADRKETEGTGLGLSLVVSCMEAHGGRVEIRAADDGGTAVSLVLPTEKS